MGEGRLCVTGWRVERIRSSFEGGGDSTLVCGWREESIGKQSTYRAELSPLCSHRAQGTVISSTIRVFA